MTSFFLYFKNTGKTHENLVEPWSCFISCVLLIYYVLFYIVSKMQTKRVLCIKHVTGASPVFTLLLKGTKCKIYKEFIYILHCFSQFSERSICR